jgi:hypothetical protein
MFLFSLFLCSEFIVEKMLDGHEFIYVKDSVKEKLFFERGERVDISPPLFII